MSRYKFTLCISSLILLLCMASPANSSKYGLFSKVLGKDPTLLKISTQAFVEGPYAQIEFIQMYKNPHNDPIETEFLFPRTDSSIFHKFEAMLGDKVVKGQIYEKEEAKVRYEQSVEQGHTAAYSERSSSAPDVMKILVGNIPPGESVEIRFSIIQPLELIANKLWGLTLPIVLTERYTISTPDASRPLKDEPVITNVPLEGSSYKEWYVHVEVKADSAFEFASNPSHNLSPQLTEKVDGKSQKVYKAVWDAVLSPDKNFVVYFKPEKVEDPSVVVAQHKDNPDDYALLVNFVPELNNLKYHDLKEALQDMKEGFLRLKKTVQNHDKQTSRGEFIFIIDRSGSMQGARIQNLKRALKKFLEVLPVDSYFNIFSFGSSYFPYSQESIKYSPHELQRALVWIESIDADMGGTEILAPLQQTTSLPQIEDYPRIVMLLTDGDVSEPDRVIQTALDHSQSMRFCTVGIGFGASEYLVKNVAKVGGGTSEFVLDNEDIGDKALHMIESAVSHHLKNVNLRVDCYDQKDNILKSFTKQVNVLLKDQPFKEFILLPNLKEVSYCNANLEYYNSLSKSFVKRPVTIDGFGNPEVTDLWHKIAYDAKIKALDQQIKFGHYEVDKEALKVDIIKNSVKYQVLSDYTAFFALIAENTAKPGEAVKVSIPNVNSADYNYQEPQIMANMAMAAPRMHMAGMKMARGPSAASYSMAAGGAQAMAGAATGASYSMPAPPQAADVHAYIDADISADSFTADLSGQADMAAIAAEAAPSFYREEEIEAGAGVLRILEFNYVFIYAIIVLLSLFWY